NAKNAQAHRFVAARFLVLAECHRRGVFATVNIVNAEHPFALPALSLFGFGYIGGRKIQMVKSRKSVAVSVAVSWNDDALIFVLSVRESYGLPALKYEVRPKT